MENTERITREQRETILGRAVHNAVAEGSWRVESQIATSATMVKGVRTKHLLHLVLTLMSGLLWAPIWAIVTYLNRRQVMTISVDEFGNVNKSMV